MANTLPNTIGPFVVLRQLGEGSMGVVYAGFDVDLDRKVALKLVHRSLVGKPQARARMLREAQALARLSSPHVVQVYQVGEHRDGSIYLAMEYVEGQTLRVWLKERRPWPRVLRTICDAGRGLAAAHAAGLVHRDFKPENVLIDGDDRPRVLDFGLVVSEGEADDDEPLSVASIEHASYLSTLAAQATPLSEIESPRGFRRVVGTPAYMSPEQHLSEVTGPTSDVYSFAVTLYEGLYGVRPFTGASWQEIREKALNGVVPPPPTDTKVPRRIFRVVARGLAVSPEERWPSIDAMLAALEHDPWKRRVQALGVVGALGAVSALSYSAAVQQTSGSTSCDGAGGVVTAIWGEKERRGLEVAFRATGASFAEDARSRVTMRLDGYAAELARAQRRLCVDNLAGAATPRLLDLRSACLGRRRSRLARLVDVLVTADRDTVENAVQAAAALPSVGGCDDDDRLLSAQPLPEDEVIAARVKSLQEELSRAESMESLGHYDTGIALAQEVYDEALLLGYSPLVAEAALDLGSALAAAGRAGESEAPLVEALNVGIQSDLHEVAAEAASRWIYAVGEGLGRHAEALGAAPFAVALVDRVGDDGRLRALLHNNLGLVFDLAGDDARARAEYERTIQILATAKGEPDPLLATTHHNLGSMLFDQGDLVAARTHHGEARELYAAILGEQHPVLGHPLASLGDIAIETGRVESAVALYSDALVRMERSYGVNHVYVTQPLAGLGRAHARQRSRVAVEEFRRVIEIAESQNVAAPPVADALVGLAEIELRDGLIKQARINLDRAAAVIVEAEGSKGWRYARVALQAGLAAQIASDRGRAIYWFEEALDSPSGSRGAVIRAQAALALAQVLLEGDAPSAEARVRVCALVDEASRGLVEASSRAEAERVRARACIPP
ncbi:MAG: serine/threonine-protein kinase [Nannocystaceae bacterium]